jgi:twinkle protein
MGKILVRNQPCLRCKSSDAVQVYEEGPAKCFSCQAAYNYNREYAKKHGTAQVEYKQDNYKRSHFKKEISLDDIDALPSRGIAERLITKKVAEFFKVKASYDEKGDIDRYYFPFSNSDGTTTLGYKTKNPRDKGDQYVVGEANNLFGIEHFMNGGKRIVVTEGEEDALAVAETSLRKYGSIYPVCSMGGVSQTTYLLKNRDVLRKFNEIVIWFDADDQGQKAAKEAGKILGADKVKIVKANEKDACDTLKHYGSEEGTKKAWNYIWDAKPYSPSGILAGEETWDRYEAFKNLTFIPWPPFLSTLNKLTHGRALGTITMIAAGTSIGKSTLLREDIYHLLKTTDEKIGAIFLEEDVGETVGGLMSIHLNKRLGLPGVEVTTEQERLAWEATAGQPNRIILLDHQGSLSDNSLIDKIEYMALSGCRYLYLDHITIAVSETEDGNANAAIDKFMSDLLKLVKRHNIWIGVVSHLRKVKSGEDSFESGAPISEDDLKGSGSLKQISFQTIAISRNKLAENELVRNRSQIYLLKDRKTGNTGPAGAYRYNSATGRLEEVEKRDEDEFEIIKIEEPTT